MIYLLMCYDTGLSTDFEVCLDVLMSQYKAHNESHQVRTKIQISVREEKKALEAALSVANTPEEQSEAYKQNPRTVRMTLGTKVAAPPPKINKGKAPATPAKSPTKIVEKITQVQKKACHY